MQYQKALTRRFAALTAATLAVVMLLLALSGCSDKNGDNAVNIDPQIKTLVGGGLLDHDQLQATCTAAMNAQIAAALSGDMMPIGLLADTVYKKSSGTANLTGSATIRRTGSEQVIAVNKYSTEAASWVYNETDGVWTIEDKPCYMPNLKLEHLINPSIKRDTGVYIINSSVEPKIVCQIVNRAAGKILIDPEATNLAGEIEMKYDVNTNLPVSLRLVAHTDTSAENESTTGVAFDLTSFTLNMTFSKFSDISVKLPKDLPHVGK